ncbi:MAG: lysophospholipase [Bdellovibrionia bacterium]
MRYNRSEGFVKSFDNTKLFFQVWQQENALGTLFITHGQGEHSGSYSRVVEGIKDSNLNIVAWDLRGHGRSEGRRGFVNNFSEYVRDYNAFFAHALHMPFVAGKKKIALSHSMGALTQLRAFVETPDLQKQFDAQVLSSPALGLALPIPAWKRKGANFINSFVPQVTLWNEITNEMLTHDLDVIKEFERDPFRHNRISPSAFLGFMESWDIVLPQASSIRLPTLLQVPEVDPVANTPISREFFERLGSLKKEVFIYPGAQHEIYNETLRQTVYYDLKHFISHILEN